MVNVSAPAEPLWYTACLSRLQAQVTWPARVCSATADICIFQFCAWQTNTALMHRIEPTALSHTEVRATRLSAPAGIALPACAAAGGPLSQSMSPAPCLAPCAMPRVASAFAALAAVCFCQCCPGCCIGAGTAGRAVVLASHLAGWWRAMPAPELRGVGRRCPGGPCAGIGAEAADTRRCLKRSVVRAVVCRLLHDTLGAAGSEGAPRTRVRPTCAADGWNQMTQQTARA